MSDLISRSGLIVKIEEAFDGGLIDCFDDVIGIIEEQPTAYSVDKIIDELDKASYRIDDSATLSSRDVIDIDDAIEIVRQGDVGKDVE